MADSSLELLQGTLDVLILKSLSWGPAHGYAVADLVRARSGEELKVEEGALYPALHRLEKRGLLEAEWGVSENNRRAKFYRLTAAGRAHLRAETQVWKRYAAAVTRVLEAA
ncbi:PadR family transcriptional regulator [Archangium sp.]|uniref:PadR family transcriptional regulator n=1 Tax=Archangium sp. TaxID=1872627 RepID=UPI00286BDF18|nr:PadR family transcriptional regulator [Archangium sp.]HLM44359.1 PadR family transcriptional regulator [Myxococcaceae bacterium]